MNGGIRSLITVLRTYLDLRLTKDFWKMNSIYIQYNGRRLKILFLDGLSMLEEIFIDEIYNCKVKHQPIIVDIGANVGFYSIWAGCNYKNPRINVDENHMNIKIYKKAVGGKAGKDTIYLSYASGLSSLTQRSDYDSEEVEVITLKDVFEQNNLKKIDILKIDTEGSEYNILSKAEQLLGKIHNILLEYHSRDDLEKLLTLFKKNNFEVVRADDGHIGIIITKNRTYG
ncbi:MAG: FkbM family methyltransferase [Candidatus Micrarchaeia archaeon]